MSQEDDVELRDLVIEALEKNGVLSKIRAQLRANIFMTLENEHHQKHQNLKLKEVLSTHDGLITFLLIQDLLDFCNLLQTSTVFKSESGQNVSYVYERQPLLEIFKFAKVSETCDIPILVQLMKFLFSLSKSSQFDNGNVSVSNHVDTPNERSFGSEGSLNAGVQNNTFLVNSGRSDNYDLSFASDTETSASSDDKNKIVLPLNLNRSSDSDESLSTEIGIKHSKDVKSDESSIKQDESFHDQSESTRIVSEILLNESSKEQSMSSEESSQKSEEESVKPNPIKKPQSNCVNSYSKYLKEKHKAAQERSNAGNNTSEQVQVPPVDNVMKHFINSRIHSTKTDSTSDESLSEEIVQAFENNGHSDESVSLALVSQDTVRTESIASPIPNILDETIPESPNTKERVLDNINSLKHQSLKSTKLERNIIQKAAKNLTNLLNDEPVRKKDQDLDVNSRNEKNKLGDVEKSSVMGLNDVATLVIEKNIKILPSYKTQSEKILQGISKGVLVDNASHQDASGKAWKDS